MAAVEYLGGLPGREKAVPVEVTVHGQALRVRHGGFLGGWTYQLPLAAIARVEMTTLGEVREAGRLPSADLAAPGEAGERLLAIDSVPEADPVALVLRGPWATLDQLRQDVLKGRMRAAKQWHS